MLYVVHIWTCTDLTFSIQCFDSCITHVSTTRNKIQNITTTSENSLISPFIVNFSPSQRQLLSDFYPHWLVLPVLELHLNGNTQDVICCVWFLLLNIMSVRFLHIACVSSCSFLFLSNISLCKCTTICLTILLLKDIWNCSNIWLL